MVDKPYWLTIPGAKLTQREREFLFVAAGQVPEYGAAVNIGVMWGASLHCLRAGMPDSALLIGIDIDYKTYPLKYPELLGNHLLIEGDSKVAHRVTDTISGGTVDLYKNIDLLFVDGSHIYEDVREDIRWWVPKVRKDGLIIFHDYNPAREDLKRDPTLVGVKQAVDEWALSAHKTLKLYAATDSIVAFRRLE